jgi:hypothetical protein
LFASVRAHRNASADERLDAYRANIKGAHLQALDQAYPVLREVLGPRYWRQLLEAELPVYASSSPDLNAYGDFMPELLREAQRQRPELRDLPYLEALATLEWQVHRARLNGRCIARASPRTMPCSTGMRSRACPKTCRPARDCCAAMHSHCCSSTIPWTRSGFRTTASMPGRMTTRETVIAACTALEDSSRRV